MENKSLITQTKGKELLTNLKTTSIKTAVEQSKGLDSLGVLNAYHVKGVIKLIILDVATFYKEVYTDEDIDILSSNILTTLKHCTFADLAVFRQNCLMGNYTLKFRLTPNVFLDWAKDYVFERNEVYATHNTRNEDFDISPKTVEFLKVTIKPKETKEVESLPESSYQIELRKRANELTKEFNVIWKQQTNGEGGVRFIEVDGKMLNIEMYLKLKL